MYVWGPERVVSSTYRSSFTRPGAFSQGMEVPVVLFAQIKSCLRGDLFSTTITTIDIRIIHDPTQAAPAVYVYSVAGRGVNSDRLETPES